MIKFIIGRLKSLKYVFKGVCYLVQEPPIIVHLFTTLMLCVSGFYFKISSQEWIIQTLGCGVILTTESLNTIVEKICDFINPDFNKKIGIIKDIAAGTVAFIVIAVAIALAIIYYPYVATKFLS